MPPPPSSKSTNDAGFDDCVGSVNAIRFANNRIFSFTLAEVLITLGIIGIVAAMTFPSLYAKYRAKSLETAFKKSVSTLYQAYDLTKAQLGVYNIKQTYVQYDENLKRYIGYEDFVTTFEKNLRVVKEVPFYKYKNYNGTQTITVNVGGDYPAATKILADGSSYGMLINSGVIMVFIDTTGPYKGPNQYGHDIFRFDIGADNRITPLAMKKLYTQEEIEESSYRWPGILGYPCSEKSNQLGNGLGCAWYAINDVNPDDKTKRYWISLPSGR